MISTATLILAASTAAVVSTAPPVAVEPPPIVLETPESFVPMKGLHLTAWVAGTRKLRRKFLAKTSGTVINAIVVPIKEIDGRVYIPGVASAKKWETQRIAIPRPAELVDDIHALGMLAVARVVVFEDNKLPRKNPEWGIQDVDGGLWENRKKLAWANPYHREVWEYNLEIASKAISYGFDEIQFDYIRFPSDGKIDRCRYPGIDHSSATAVANIVAFLSEAKRRFDPLDVPVSAALFGLVVSARDDLGIGQDIDDIVKVVDAVSPMMYPSHYIRGAYGLKHPNASPGKVIDFGIRDGTRRLKGLSYRLRPYLQDFSLGVRYREKEVRAQIDAAVKRGIHSWILWNPQNRYTWDAVRDAIPESAITPPGDSAESLGDLTETIVRPIQSPPIEGIDVPPSESASDGKSVVVPSSDTVPVANDNRLPGAAEVDLSTGSRDAENKEEEDNEQPHDSL